MPTSKKVHLTEEGLEKLVLELERLKKIERPRVITLLKEAREQGDLSENAEYDAARTEQAILEARIQELEQMVEYAEIVDERIKDKVSIGTKVTIKYVEDSELEVYSIVGSIEADPFNNKISYESPIAKAIIDKKIGDKVTVESPNGKYQVQIVEIN
jgi:transcription elongation factor GreA